MKVSLLHRHHNRQLVDGGWRLPYETAGRPTAEQRHDTGSGGHPSDIPRMPWILLYPYQM